MPKTTRRTARVKPAKPTKAPPPKAKRKADRKWSIKDIGTREASVHVLKVDLELGKTQPILLLSDTHVDNPHCDRAWLRRNLDQAMEQDAPIFIFGDVFCAMQGKYDRRSNKSALRDEHRTERYLDSLVETTADFFEPYKDNLAMIGYGNHETAIMDYHETDLIDRLAAELRNRGGICTAGGYQGWIRVAYHCSTKHRTSDDWFYHHGWGGGGPVTKGTIDFNRVTELVSADVYIMGHIHRRVMLDTVHLKLTAVGTQRNVPIDYIRLSTYKEEGGGRNGWAESRGMGARPIGGAWAMLGIYRDRCADTDRYWPTRQFMKTI